MSTGTVEENGCGQVMVICIAFLLMTVVGFGIIVCMG